MLINSARVLLLAVLAVAQVRTVPIVVIAIAGSRGVAAQEDGASDAFEWYPRLNLNGIPWHTASGGWGDQVRIEAPAAPVTTRTAKVDSVAQFNRAAAVDRTQITIAKGWAGDTVAVISADDIEVIIPEGIAIGAIQVGPYYDGSVPVSRVRIRGARPGEHSGGRMGQLRAFQNTYDVIVDGVDLNGDSGYGGSETNTAFRVDTMRLAVLNVRAIAAGAIWLGTAKHVVIANSNFYHGAAARADLPFVEGWGIRNSAGPITIVDSRIQGTRYFNVRVHSEDDDGELLYIARSTFVALAEGRTVEMWNDLPGGAEGGIGRGGIIEDSAIYSYTESPCPFGQAIVADNVIYSRIRNNVFYGGGQAVFTQRYLDSQAARGGGNPGDHDWSVGNKFEKLVSVPAWGGPGDPTRVPLPGGLTIVEGEGDCPGGP